MANSSQKVCPIKSVVYIAGGVSNQALDWLLERRMAITIMNCKCCPGDVVTRKLRMTLKVTS